VIWTTQLGATTIGEGSSGGDICRGVAVDSSQNVYCAGRTSGALGEAKGGSYDAFITKLNSSGAVIWTTQLGATTIGRGSSGSDYCYGVAVDTSQNVYCAGETSGALGEAKGGSRDAFITKLNSSGELIWTTQLGATTIGEGSSGYDYCLGVAVDTSQNVYCAGETSGALGEANGGSGDAFITKLNSSGAVIWTTQLGATTIGEGSGGSDHCWGVAVDTAGNVYCAGDTSGALGEANGGGYDAFITKLNSSGELIWTTQLGATTIGAGSSANDYCRGGVSVDTAQNVYCAGRTDGALGEANGGNNDAFITKLNSSGAVIWTTQLGATTIGAGSSGLDSCWGVAVDTVDTAQNIYCAGETSGALGEAKGSSSDAFIMKLDPSGKL
jgi:hypothetical protein